MDAYVTSAALNAALELGLFWLLAEQPLDTAAVARALDIPPARCAAWLHLLGTTGLIALHPEGYAPTPVAQSAILDACSQDTWALLAQDARDRYPAILDLAVHLREPGSTWTAQGRSAPDYFAQMVESPERARRFTRTLYELHLPLAEALADVLDMGGVTRMLDLGGGSGVMSMALLRRWSDLRAVVVDINTVCAAGREIAAEQALEHRLTYHAADFLRDELPSGVELVLQCDAGGYSEALLQKIRVALAPAGRLVIVDQFAPEPGAAPATAPYPVWAFLASLDRPEVRYATVDEVQARLQQAGYSQVSATTLPQRGTQRWTEGWIMIEARLNHPDSAGRMPTLQAGP
jgi:SAM-dependent methyltransferase